MCVHLVFWGLSIMRQQLIGALIYNCTITAALLGVSWAFFNLVLAK